MPISDALKSFLGTLGQRIRGYVDDRFTGAERGGFLSPVPPTPTPDPFQKMYDAGWRDVTPTKAPTPTPTPTPPPAQNLAGRPFSNEISSAWGPQSDLAHQILRYVTPSGDVLGENTGYQTGTEVDIQNNDGSIDRGLFRINSNTFADFMNRKPQVLLQNGISSWDDMLNPLLNARMAKIIFDEQGGGAWYAAPPWIRGQ